MAAKENKVQAAILKYLKEQGIFCWRQNNHPTYDHKLQKYRAHTGLRGVPDILGILPDGRFLGVEVKQKAGVISSDQLLFINRCNRLGGVCFVARSVDDAKSHLPPQHHQT